MSHTVEIKTEVRDADAVASACRRLGLPESRNGAASLFQGEATGLLVQLPGWNYPIVITPETGKIQFDNYGGLWGDQAQLDRFLQAYAVEKAKIEACKQGYTVTEHVLSDGSIDLNIYVGGGE